VGGSLITQAVNSVTVGQVGESAGPGDGVGTAAAASLIEGGVVVSHANDAGPTNFTLTGGSTIGSLVVAGGNAGDLVRLGSPDAAAPTGAGVVLGNAVSVLGAGDNTVSLDGAQVNGILSTVTGPGDDVLELLGTTLVGGDAGFVGGDGANTVTGGGTSAINGNFYVTTGNGADVVQGVAAPGLETDVGGSLTVNMGNGANTFGFSGRANGLGYVGGGGADNVTLTGAFAFALDVRLGSGNDTFTYSAGTTVGRAYLDFGFGEDTFDDGGVIVDWPQVMTGL
jgi:hypothetical protein